MLKRITSWLYLRRVSHSLAAIVTALEQQNALLARLADHFAPLPPTPDRATTREQTGVDFLDEMDAYLAADYVARTQSATGHVPNDEEILIYLADEKTRDLASRLSARDAELTRLEEESRL